MPFPRSSLDLIIIPQQKDYLPTTQAEKKFLQVAQKQRWINNFSAGPSAQEFILNGFGSIRIERHKYPILFANHQGGYRVLCPTCSSHLAKEFSSVVTKYRKDRSSFSINCISCTSSFQLDQLRFQPTAGFAKYALVIKDVNSIEISEKGTKILSYLMENFQVILKRMG